MLKNRYSKTDLLIANFGESYMKKHKRERMVYACSNRMGELSRLLINFRQIKNDKKITFTEILHPKKFDDVLFATRKIVGYDHEKKNICNAKSSYAFRHFLKKWHLWNKELQEKRWNKPLLLALVSDIKKFRDEVTRIAEGALSKLSLNSKDKQAFKLLNKCVLSILILFNRRRIGDVQYLKIDDYKANKTTNYTYNIHIYTDFENALTETEKALTKKYKRVLNSGKGSRSVVILVPEELGKMVDALLEHRITHCG
ncbi:unnamed protein product [Brassicogethes aeneus]|uniref:Uncharacterized protein n=1 Tax=Brassicogethes aeneus TaxID=1431903 RepID=A0A9P0ASB5_BRAAE|nr:unnamed protein product [Brassicogethes aeneus]